MGLNLVRHPLLEHKTGLLRNIKVSAKDFREIVTEISFILAYEATRNSVLRDKRVPSWMGCEIDVKAVDDNEPMVVPILRAGLGMVDGFLKLMPLSKVCMIGIQRDESNALPTEYYQKFVRDTALRQSFILDPMLATGGSAVKTIEKLKSKNVRKISLLSVIGAQEGVRNIQTAHPEVEIYLAALDEKLDENFYIIPGLGDAGDRIFNTF